MPHWSDESAGGYKMGAGIGINPGNIQLPGLGGRSPRKVVAGSGSSVDHILAGLPIPDGEIGDWDSPAEVMLGAVSWGETGNTQAYKKPGFQIAHLAVAALAFLMFKSRR